MKRARRSRSCAGAEAELSARGGEGEGEDIKRTRSDIVEMFWAIEESKGEIWERFVVSVVHMNVRLVKWS